MKVILSKKGLDSGCCNWPIFLKKNTKEMPFIPIPEMDGMHTYGVLNKTSCKLCIHKNNEEISIDNNATCHLDPQLKNYFGDKFAENFGAFGQSGRAQSHLNNCGVGVGDLFLFYGWYYDENTKKDENIIFGYMKIGSIIYFDKERQPYLVEKPYNFNNDEPIKKQVEDQSKKYENKKSFTQLIEFFPFLKEQPHLVRLKDDFETNYKNDVIYIAENGGFGFFNYKESLILTDKKSNCKTEWFIKGLKEITELRPMRRDVALKEGKGRLVKGYCQELVIDCKKYPKVQNWVNGLINNKK